MTALESLGFLRSELILVGASVVILVLDFFITRKVRLGWLAVISIFAAILIPVPFYPPRELFSGYFILDPFTHFFKMAALLAVGLTLLASLSYEKMPENGRGEFYVLLLVSAFLLILMGGANNLLMIFLTIESVSLTSYLLVGLQKFDKRSSESALKYVLFGAVSSAVMLFGMSLLFGATGSIWLAEIASRLAGAGTPVLALGFAGFAFLLVGIGFKISMAPFHMWAPDVYQGAATPVSAFLTVAPKTLGFAVMARVLFVALPQAAAHWNHLLAWLAILTMTLGNLIAVSQVDVKRLLAYSSVAQAGYILAALSLRTSLGLDAVLIYLAAYLFTNLGAFFTVLAVERQTGSNRLDAYNGLSQKNPFLAAAMTIFMLSLAGIPPLAGFIGKVYIFASALDAKAVGLAVVIGLNSAVAAFYYFKLVKAMYLTPAESSGTLSNPIPVRMAVTATLLGTLFLGLFPTYLIHIVRQSLAGFTIF